MTDYFTSDLHFGHRNIIRYCQRPFEDDGDMNYQLIRRWNAIVRPEDRVFVLGDFAFGNKENKEVWFTLLNGDKYLVEGNHDPRATRELGWSGVYKRHDMIVGGYRLHMVHNPNHADMTGYSGKTLVLHGHLHGMSDLHPYDRKYDCPYVDVGVDCWGYEPISLDRIATWLDTGDGRPGPAVTQKQPEGEE